MSNENCNLIVAIIAALGTWAIAIIAIWGESIKSHFGGPKLEIALLDPEGKITTFGDGTPVRYYHLTISNKRRWNQAHNVRVVICKITKPAADKSFTHEEPLSGPLQLHWQFPFVHPQYPTIGPDDICDLGFLKKGEHFELATYIKPNNINTKLASNQRMRVEIKAVADNAESNTLPIDISWDGNWSDDTPVMAKHLVIKEIT